MSRVIAALALLMAVLSLLIWVTYFATGMSLEEYHTYFTSNPGVWLERGIKYLVTAVVLGTLFEISAALSGDK